MSIKEVMPALRRWSSEGHRCGVAILYGAQHSSPRPVGSCLAVADDGRMAGAISMGCVESDIHANLMEILREKAPPRRLHYGAVNDYLLDVGLTCGGEIDVLLMACDPDGDAWKFLDIHSSSRLCLLGILVDGPGAGEHACLSADGDRAGQFSRPGHMQVFLEKAGEYFVHQRSGGVKLEDGSCLFIQVFSPPLQLAIVGGSPIAVSLCEMAVQTGFEVTVIDPRKTVAPEEYYPKACRVIHQWPDQGMREAGVNDRWYVAVLSHDQKLDVPALETALDLECYYIGMLGSRSTMQKRLAELQEHGYGHERTDRIHSPIGMKSIGAVTSPEIAVSVLAQMIACRYHAASA